MMDPEFDVADAFKKATTDRAAGLAGRLGTRPPARRVTPTQAPTEPVEAAVLPEAAQSPPAPDNPTQSRRKASPRRKSDGGEGRIVVALPIGLRDRARAHASSRGETYLDVTLAAVQEVHSRLPQLIADRHNHEDETPTHTGLFEHRPRRRRTPEATAQVTIRGLTPHDRDVLDQLVGQVGAANLTELLTAALDEYLPQRPRSLR